MHFAKKAKNAQGRYALSGNLLLTACVKEERNFTSMRLRIFVKYVIMWVLS